MGLFAEDEPTKAEIEEKERKVAQWNAEQARLSEQMKDLRKTYGKRLPSIQVSVSQVEKAEACPRKWAFERLFRMREPGQRYGATFGNVLHSVLERWLKADDHGRDRLTGKEVDIYPPGWQFDRGGRRIQPDHDELMQRMVQAAIDKGVLRREPGRVVEGEFWAIANAHDVQASRQFGPDSLGHFAPSVVVNGKIDLETPHKIGDHKSVKDMRWAKSAQQLFGDLQGGVYAHRKFQLDPTLEKIEFEHYCYDWSNEKITTKRAKDPATGEAGMTRVQAARIWERFMRTARDMQLFTNVPDPFKIPGARQGAGKGKDECTAFGGCGFISVCTKGTVEEFVRIRDRLALLSLPREAQEQIAEEQQMKPVSKLKGTLGMKAKAAAQPEEDEEEEAPAPKAKKKAAPVVEEEEEEEEAPPPKAKKKPAPVVEEDEEEEEEAPPPKAKKKPAPVVEEDEEEEEEAPPTKGPGKKVKAPVFGDDEEEEEAPAPKAKKKAAPVVEEDEEESDEDESEVEGEGEERAKASLLKTLRADLMKQEKSVLVDRLIAGIAGLKGL